MEIREAIKLDGPPLAALPFQCIACTPLTPRDAALINWDHAHYSVSCVIFFLPHWLPLSKTNFPFLASWIEHLSPYRDFSPTSLRKTRALHFLAAHFHHH